MAYHHLSQEERYQISALLKEGLTQAQIALNLGRHKSTINREMAGVLDHHSQTNF
jgi:IS30 family transposase